MAVRFNSDRYEWSAVSISDGVDAATSQGKGGNRGRQFYIRLYSPRSAGP